MIRVTRRRAAQLAIMGQLLDRDRPAGVLDTVTRLGRVQMDPTAVVARTEHLALFSRLGRYDRRELDRLRFTERSLFEYWAFILPMADLHVHRATMRRYLERETTHARYLRRWLREHDALRRRVVRELGRRGPLRSRDIADDTRTADDYGGWGSGRSVAQILDALWAMGEVAIVGRDGNERVWGLARDWYPRGVRAASERAAARATVERQLRTLGVATAGETGRGFGGQPAGWERALAELVREGRAVPVAIDGLPGERYAWGPLLERPFHGRTAILSPFDRLIHDRTRALELFGFDYRLEIYVPPAQRRWGYYVLPVLRGDRVIARFDARRDEEARTLRVLAMYAEPGATAADARAVAREVRTMSRWLGLREVSYERVPRGWRRELEA
ncbi:MAG TPA: crosslink repair DNA glycosylase YcaQ family protein [Candidatus Limnocylindria bacterium]|nr:crosslink repair DNA glycosylase YcaQ family protein [Candidatus Limnocylindria bacterium]